MPRFKVTSRSARGRRSRLVTSSFRSRTSARRAVVRSCKPFNKTGRRQCLADQRVTRIRRRR